MEKECVCGMRATVINYNGRSRFAIVGSMSLLHGQGGALWYKYFYSS